MNPVVSSRAKELLSASDNMLAPLQSNDAMRKIIIAATVILILTSGCSKEISPLKSIRDIVVGTTYEVALETAKFHVKNNKRCSLNFTPSRSLIRVNCPSSFSHAEEDIFRFYFDKKENSGKTVTKSDYSTRIATKENFTKIKSFLITELKEAYGNTGWKITQKTPKTISVANKTFFLGDKGECMIKSEEQSHTLEVCYVAVFSGGEKPTSSTYFISQTVTLPRPQEMSLNK